MRDKIDTEGYRMAHISEEEKRSRRQKNESVIGTLAMEGLTLDATSAEIGRRFVEGEITLEQFSSQMQAHVEALTAAARKQHRRAS